MSEPKTETARVVGFTPGPWHVTTCADLWVEHGCPITEADDGFTGIAHCGDIDWPNCIARQAEWTANATLIAAAPDLLEALQELRRICSDIPAIERNPRFAEASRAALAAIAKATG